MKQLSYIVHTFTICIIFKIIKQTSSIFISTYSMSIINDIVNINYFIPLSLTLIPITQQKA